MGTSKKQARLKISDLLMLFHRKIEAFLLCDYYMAEFAEFIWFTVTQWQRWHC